MAEGLAKGGMQERAHGRAGCGWLASLVCLGLAVALLPLPVQARTRAGVGLNLSPWDYYSADFPLIDQFKRSSGWLTQCEPQRDAACRGFTGDASAWDTRERTRLDLDAQGWVRRLPSADDTSVRFRAAAVLLFQGNGRAHPAGKYVVTYEGKGLLAHDLIGRKIESESRPGRDVVDVTNHTDGGWRLSLLATDPADPLRNIRVFPPGGACARDLGRYADSAAACDEKTHGAFVPFEKFPAELRWHPRYLQDLRGFRVLRFMDWAKTNHSPVEHWAERPQPDAASWSGEGGVPWEAMLDLTQAAGADPWLNLPMRADDDYVRGFARLLREKLPAGRVAIVEYANEPWNQAFPVAKWLQQRAAAQWPAAAGDAASAANWYAWRSAQICQMVKAAWPGQAAPVRCVLNAHGAQPDLTAQMLACPQAAAALGAACGRRVDALAIAPYFGGYLGSAELRPLVAGWPQEPDGGLDKTFQELLAEDARGAPVAATPLRGQPGAAEGGALAQARALMRTARVQAARFGLPLWAYEGGQHLTMPPGADDASWLGLITRANRDPRMGRAYERHLADWRAAGGELFVWFNHVAQPSRWGVWGLKETQFSEASVKWQVVRGMRDGLACWWPGCAR